MAAWFWGPDQPKHDCSHFHMNVIHRPDVALDLSRCFKETRLVIHFHQLEEHSWYWPPFTNLSSGLTGLSCQFPNLHQSRMTLEPVGGRNIWIPAGSQLTFRFRDPG